MRVAFVRLTAPQDVRLYGGGYDGELLAAGASVIEDRDTAREIRAYPALTVKVWREERDE